MKTAELKWSDALLFKYKILVTIFVGNSTLFNNTVTQKPKCLQNYGEVTE